MLSILTRSRETLCASAVVVFAALLSAVPALEAGQTDLPGLHRGGPPRPPETDREQGAQEEPAPRPAPQTTVEDGFLCTSVDFEGVDDVQPVPEFEGIRSPDWLGIIDADAGGSGNFAFEPSPETIAFWLGGPTGTGSSRDIVFDEPASVVEFFYASAVTTRLTAFDSQGRQVAATSGPANFGAGPGGDPTGRYNQWDPLRLETDDNRIARIRVAGAINQTGIDDLKVCRRNGIDTVEITQAIQEIQDLDELQADLADDREPPVPLVRGKPAALRIYFREVQTPSTVRVAATLDGGRQVRRFRLQPGCTRDEMRLQANGCQSADFYFTPRSSRFEVELEVQNSDGVVIEEHTLPLRTRAAEPIVLGAVRLCDTRDGDGGWLCEDRYATRLTSLVPMLRKLAPTAVVRVEDTGETLRREIDPDRDGTVTDDEADAWWSATARELDGLFGLLDGIRDFLGLDDFRYFGLTRAGIGGGPGGKAAWPPPSRGALGRSSVRVFGMDFTREMVAHEVFHTMGRRHTHNGTPSSNRSPGCFGFAPDGATDWPYRNLDNRIRSGPPGNSMLEVGFDVARSRALAPRNTFDVMSYCAPMWIAPHTYRRLLDEALEKAATVPATKQEAGEFWKLSGTASGSGVELDPVFRLSTVGPTDEGTGALRLEVRSGSRETLFTRRFDAARSETLLLPGQDPFPSRLHFAELVPVQPGAERIVLLDADDRVLGSVGLGGAPPDVTISFPQGGEVLAGARRLSWTASAPGGGALHYWVQYSADGGATGSWRTLGFVDESELTVDFDDLSGTRTSSLIRVLASDGAASSVTVSAPFTVPSKGPRAQIAAPDEGDVVRRGDLVWLQGAGFDPEDGALDDEALSWSSSVDGALGTGASLPVTDLSPGEHTITLTATDGEDATALDRVRLVVAGAGPTLELGAEALDQLPTTCVEATVDPRPGSVPLDVVEYSLDGGETWTRVPLGALPHRFIVPGSGFFHLVARAFDVAGQLAVQDERFFTAAECEDALPSPPAGAWLTTDELPGFRFKVRITAGGDPVAGRGESDCIGETLCVSGNLPGRSELFTRIIGPRPNGHLWVNLVRFTTSEVELWIEQSATGNLNYYALPPVERGSSVLTGLVDKEAFVPGGKRSSRARGWRARSPADGAVEAVEQPRGPLSSPLSTVDAARSALASPESVGSEATFRSPRFPDYRFTVRIFSGGSEIPTRRESDCLAETLCVSGALPGRSELFVRLIGPRPNGFLWTNLVRFTTSRVEVEIEKLSTGERQSYVLPEIPRASDSLDGLVDKEAFRP